jgi:hypothetical protein
VKESIKSHFSGNYESFYRKYLPKIENIGGEEWRAVCPFHDDTDPSLNINMNTGQYFCHGCGKKGDIFHFYGKINGLATGPDFGKILHGIASDFGISKPNQPKSKITATYNYHDINGKPIFQVVRLEPGKNGKKKDFRQRRPGANGQWVWNLKGVDTVLYRLPEIASAGEVLLVEGEKDCDNLRALGFTATTCPQGAGKWKNHYSQFLKGKQVVLIPDNDNPGREHMTKVATAINGDAAALKLLNIPGLPSKGDVSDFIAGFKDKSDAAERLAMMIDGCPPYKPPKKVTLEDAILDVGEFHRLEITQRKEFLSPWLKEDAIILCSGWRGTGKTFFALGVLDAVSNGGTFGPWHCQTAAPCLFLDGEMPPADIQERSAILNLNTQRKSPLHIYSDAYANILGLSRANLNSDKWRQTMKRILTTRGIKVWVIDNLASVAGGLDENSRQEWDPVNQWLLELRFAGITTIMLHHTGKGGQQRGTSAREDNLDCSIILKSPPDYTPEDGARFICHFSKARVKAAALPLIQDTEFKLTVDESGEHDWSCGGVRQTREIEILNLLHDGMKQIDVANALSINRGQVSKLRQKAIKNGWLNNQNKLLPKGYEFIKNGQI